MQFCSECSNMYYMRLGADDGGIYSDTLQFYCRHCGHEDSTLTNENIICVSEYQTQSSDMKLKNMINKYTKYDPTLPRANNILCPNPQCTNHAISVEAPQTFAAMPVSAIPVSAMPVPVPTRTIKTSKKTASATNVGGAATDNINANTINADNTDIGQIPPSIRVPIQEESMILKSRDSDIIYIRYDDENMKYAWICSKCDSTWTNDNHIDNKKTQT